MITLLIKLVILEGDTSISEIMPSHEALYLGIITVKLYIFGT